MIRNRIIISTFVKEKNNIMKKIFSTLSMALLFCAVAIAQNPTTIEASPEVGNEPAPVMTFDEAKVDFGTIEQHSDPVRFFNFTNTGDAPLVIQSCKGSCGCTVPTWPKESIMPGETAQIKVRYDTKRLGAINKRVTITTNEVGDPHVIKVVGKINAAPKEEGVPAARPTVISAPSQKGGGK